LVIRFKDINNRYFKKQIEHKKGIFENEFTFDTGTHKYINHFTFTQPQANTIGVIKNVYSENNNSVIWNKPNTNFTFQNSSSSVYQSYDDIIETETENFSDVYNYYEQTFTSISSIGNYQPCDCNSNEEFFPIRVKIVDYNLNNKIPFVFIGRAFITKKTINWNCYSGTKTLIYYEVDIYIISSDGYIPTQNVLLLDWGANSPVYNKQYGYFALVQRKLNLHYITYEGYCQMLIDRGIPRNLYSIYTPDIFIWIIEKGYNDGENFINWCPYNGEYLDVWNIWNLWNRYMDDTQTYPYWFYKINLDAGEYIKIGVLEKKMQYLCM
jgi:hypothetical protein